MVVSELCSKDAGFYTHMWRTGIIPEFSRFSVLISSIFFDENIFFGKNEKLWGLDKNRID
jgi:hypothetical protein